MLLSFLHAMCLHLLLTEAEILSFKTHDLKCSPPGTISRSFLSDCHTVLEYFQGSPSTHRVLGVYTNPNVFMWNTCRFEVQFYLKGESQPLWDVSLAGSIFLNIYHGCVRTQGRTGGLYGGTPLLNRKYDSFRGLLLEQAPLPYSSALESEDDERTALLGGRPGSSTEASDRQGAIEPVGDGSATIPSDVGDANDIVIEVADLIDPPPSSTNQGNTTSTATSSAAATTSPCPNLAARICCWENDRIWERLNPAQYLGTLVTGACSAAVGAFITWRVNNPGAAAKLTEACLEATQRGVQLKGCV